MGSEKGSFVGGWLLFIFIIVISALVFGGLRFLGRVLAERIVFENSYQYHESRKSEIAIYEAQLAEIEAQLESQSLDGATKDQLKAKAATINVQLKTARSKK